MNILGFQTNNLKFMHSGFWGREILLNLLMGNLI